MVGSRPVYYTERGLLRSVPGAHLVFVRSRTVPGGRRGEVSTTSLRGFSRPGAWGPGVHGRVHRFFWNWNRGKRRRDGGAGGWGLCE